MRALVITGVDTWRPYDLPDDFGPSLIVPVPTPPIFERADSLEPYPPEALAATTTTQLVRHIVGREGAPGEFIVYWPANWSDAWGLAEFEKWARTHL